MDWPEEHAESEFGAPIKWFRLETYGRDARATIKLEPLQSAPRRVPGSGHKLSATLKWGKG